MIRFSLPRLATLACVTMTFLTAANASAATTAAAAASAAATTSTTDADLADMQATQQFRSLFQTWKKLDGGQAPAIAVPSAHPVEQIEFTSMFGVRSDPIHGGARMHAGVDIRGPIGTPIYATADGYVGRAERSGGYGNLVELEHGKGLQTRYGHLSKILVNPGDHIRRGQLIALMGSTGRSTGSHLHYEVRMDGHAVNPVPFLETADAALLDSDRALQPVGFTTAAR